MFRNMRRSKQEISKDECAGILSRASSGVLGLCGDGGYPYTVPVSFAYISGEGYGKIYIHGATTGHKVDSVRRCDKVSFCVIDRDDIMPRERTTAYASVIVFGKARILEEENELRAAANAVGAKYSAGYEDLYMAETEETIAKGTLSCIEITIEHMTGKIGLEVMRERNKENSDNG